MHVVAIECQQGTVEIRTTISKESPARSCDSQTIHVKGSTNKALGVIVHVHNNSTRLARDETSPVERDVRLPP